MNGFVLKSTGSWYDVRSETGSTYKCRLRGKFRLDSNNETNPIAVGDYVDFFLEDSDGIITNVLDRTNFIVRKSVKKSGQSHVLAANLDQVLLVVTLAFPRTSLGFIDRFLVAAESFRIPQLLVFNKSDAFTYEERQEVNLLVEIYTKLGVTCLVTSAIKDGSAMILPLLKGKKTLIAGHSGVGKSTLINSLSDGINQTTNEVSEFSSKGTHTTTFAEMFSINESTYIIDTPGIKELGLVDISPEELSDYFVEMRSLRSACKFGARCLHVNEPKCAVLHAVEVGQIATSRYASYLSILRNEDNRK